MASISEKIHRFITKLLFPPGVTPIKLSFIFVMFLLLFGNALTLAMVFSYLPRMTKDFGIKEKDVGYYAGLIASSLFVGRAFGSYFWGWLSDKIGTRSSLLIGACLLAVTTLMFGFNLTFTWSLGTRFSQGLFNAILIPAKTAIARICDDTNQGFGMSLFMASFSAGMIIGPSIGGFLVLPAEKYPEVFSNDGLFGRFPYLLPNFITALVLLIGLFAAYFLIPRTPERISVSKDTTPLVNRETTKTYSEDNIVDKNHDIHVEAANQLTTGKQHSNVKFYNTGIEPESFLVCSIIFTPQSEYQENAERPGDKPETRARICDCTMFKNSNLGRLLRSKDVVVCVLLYCIFSLVAISFDELFPLWASTSEKLGGISFSTEYIGTTIFAIFLPILIILMFVLPRIITKYGSRKVFFVNCCFMIFLVPVFPSVGKPNNRALVWILLLPIFAIIRLASAVCFLTMNIFLNNAPEPELIGSANGLCMATSSVFRSVAPMMFGSLYSWSLGNEGKHGFPINHYFPFVLSGFFALLTLVLAVMLPPSIDNKKYHPGKDEVPCKNRTESSQDDRHNNSVTA